MPGIAQISGRLVDSLLQTSWQAALVVGTVLLAQWIFHRQVSPRWRYALWGLVVLRLLMPALPASRFSIFNLSRAQSRQPAAVDFVRTDVAALARGEPLPVMPLNASETPRMRPIIWDWRLIAAIVWLAGALLLGAALLRAHARMGRRIARTGRPCDPRLATLLKQCKQQMGLDCTVELVVTDAVATPALMGLRRPRLLLPSDLPRTLSEIELRFVFLHELAHLKCRDIAADWLLALLRLIHWFNPVIWLALARCRADRELARDAMVLSVTGRQQGQSYGQTILRLVERLGHPEPAIGAVGVVETRRQLKRRIQMIAQFRPNMTRDAVLAITLLLVVGFATLTGRSAQQDGSAPMLPSAPTTAPSPRQAALEAALNQKLDEVVFTNAAFADVIAQLGKSAKVNIVVNWREIETAGVRPETRISMRLRAVTLAKTLRLALNEAAGGPDLDYVTDDNTITITTRTDRLKNAPTHIYDIRDLLNAPDAKGKARQVADIMQMINLAQSKEDWAITGPTKEANGQVTVKALEENHVQIDEFIAYLRELKGISVLVEVTVLTIPEGFAAKYGLELGDTLLPLEKPMAATKPQNAVVSTILDDFQANFLLRAVKSQRDTQVLSSPKLTVRNGQQGVISIGNEVPYVTGIKPVTTPDGKTEYQQQLANQFEGFRFEAQPTVSADGKYVTLKAKATQTHVLAMEKIPFKDAPADQKRYTQRPKLSVREIDTSVSIPDAENLLLSVPRKPSGGEAADQDKSAQDILLLLRPTIIIKKPGEADQKFPLLHPAK